MATCVKSVKIVKSQVVHGSLKSPVSPGWGTTEGSTRASVRWLSNSNFLYGGLAVQVSVYSKTGGVHVYVKLLIWTSSVAGYSLVTPPVGLHALT